MVTGVWSLALSSCPKSSSIWFQRSHYITAEGFPNKVSCVVFCYNLLSLTPSAIGLINVLCTLRLQEKKNTFESSLLLMANYTHFVKALFFLTYLGMLSMHVCSYMFGDCWADIQQVSFHFIHQFFHIFKESRNYQIQSYDEVHFMQRTIHINSFILCYTVHWCRKLCNLMATTL